MIGFDYVNAHIAASAAQALHHQWEVARLLTRGDDRIPQPQPPSIPPVEEIERTYENSQGRGRDGRGAMLNVRV